MNERRCSCLLAIESDNSSFYLPAFPTINFNDSTIQRMRYLQERLCFCLLRLLKQGSFVPMEKGAPGNTSSMPVWWKISAEWKGIEHARAMVFSQKEFTSLERVNGVLGAIAD